MIYDTFEGMIEQAQRSSIITGYFCLFEREETQKCIGALMSRLSTSKLSTQALDTVKVSLIKER